MCHASLPGKAEGIMIMLRRCLCFFIFVLLAVPAGAADLGTPQLSEARVGSDFFSPERLLTSGGMKYGGGNVAVEPLLGLGYGARKVDESGFGAMLHKLHAQAGGKLSLLDSLYVSAAAKVPLYSYESSEFQADGQPGMGSFSRQNVDILHLTEKNLSWTGEVGMRLGLGTELTIFYDQNLLTAPMSTGGTNQQEERFGTRFIIHFR